MFGLKKNLEQGYKNLTRDVRSQWQMLITEDRRLVDVLLPVQLGECEEPDWQQAWLLDSQNTVPDFSENTRRDFQVVCDRDVAPLPLWVSNSLKFTKQSLTAIADQTFSDELNTASQISKSHLTLKALFIVNVILAITLLIKFGYAQAATSGWRWPWG